MLKITLIFENGYYDENSGHLILVYMRMTLVKFTLFSVVCMLFLVSCESTQEIQVGILWQDDPHFDDTGIRYLAVLKGECDFDTGFEGYVLDSQPVRLAENTTYYFSCVSSGAGNYTAYIFVDTNADSSYSEGYDVITGYKYNYGEPGEPLTISLSSFY